MIVQKIVSDPEIAEGGSRSACGEYPHCCCCKSFSLTLETWHEQRYTNEFLSSVACRENPLALATRSNSGSGLSRGRMVHTGRVSLHSVRAVYLV